ALPEACAASPEDSTRRRAAGHAIWLRQRRERRKLLDANYLARGPAAAGFAWRRLRPLTWMGLLRLVAVGPAGSDHLDPRVYGQPELLERFSALSARRPSEPPTGSRLIAAIDTLPRTN